MAEIKISGNMKVKKLKERFQNEFHLTLGVYENGDVADDHLSLSEIRAASGKGGVLSARKNTLVKNIESNFEKQFGIKVEVFSPDGEEPVPKDMTLQQVVERYSGNSIASDSSDAPGDILLKEIIQSNKEESLNEIAYKGHELVRQGHKFNNKEFLKLADKSGTSIAHIMAEGGHIFDDLEILKLANKVGFTVAHAMAREGYQFEDPEIWKLADEDGETVFDIMKSKGFDLDNIKAPDKKEFLKLAYKSGISIAHVMVKEGHVFDDPDILKLVDEYDLTVAHEMASRGHIFDDPEILKLARENGETVAHFMASRGHIFYDPEIWKLAREDGRTVAHEMASRGHVFDDPEIWKWAGTRGTTVAHEMAWAGYQFDDPDILKLATEDGYTVAHFMAREGYQFENPEIWKWANKRGRTVAHEMAKQGYEFEDPDILKLTGEYGLTVAHKMAEQGYEFNDPEIWKLADEDGETVADIMKSKGFDLGNFKTSDKKVEVFSPDGTAPTPKEGNIEAHSPSFQDIGYNPKRTVFLFLPRDTSDNLNDEDYGFDDIASLDDDPEEHPEVFSIMFSYICDLATNLIKAIEGNAFSGKYYAVLEDGDGKKNIIIPLFELPNSREKIPQESMEGVLTGAKFCIAVVVNPDKEEENIEDHWFSFYQVSEEYSGAFTAYGPFPPYKLARQIYDRGEPDTGIMEDSDDPQYTENDSLNQPYVDLTEKITKFHNEIGENNTEIKEVGNFMVEEKIGVDEVVAKISKILDNIIKSNIEYFSENNSFKVRPGYGYDKFYLDRITGSYDMSLQGLIHYIMYEEGIYRKILDDQQYRDLEDVIKNSPESIYRPRGEDEDIQYDILDPVYSELIVYVGKRLIEEGFDVKKTFADELGLE